MEDRPYLALPTISTSEKRELSSTSSLNPDSITSDQLHDISKIDQNKMIDETNEISVESNKYNAVIQNSESDHDQEHEMFKETLPETSDLAYKPEEEFEEIIIEKKKLNTDESSINYTTSNQKLKTNLIEINKEEIQSNDEDQESISIDRDHLNVNSSTREENDINCKSKLNEEEKLKIENNAVIDNTIIEVTKNSSSKVNEKEQIITRSLDMDYITLKSFREDSIRAENLERSKYLNKYGLFFTGDKYNYWIGLPKEFEKEFQILKKKEESYQIRLAEKRKISDTYVESSKRHEKEPIKKLKSQTSMIPLENENKEKQVFKQINQDTFSDLEVAAAAAGLWSNNSNVNAEPKSNFTREEYQHFIDLSKRFSLGYELSEDDLTTFQRMSSQVQIEKEAFIKYQRELVFKSGVYNILDPKVEKAIEKYYKLELERLKLYPQFYSYFNIMELPKNNTIKNLDFSFKKSLKATGQIAPCSSKMFDVPRKVDLFKQYFFSSQTSTAEEDEEDVEYYQKKISPDVSVDYEIFNLLTTTKTDIVISLESMILLVEILNDLSLDLCMPITVKEENGFNVIIFNYALPRETLTARERNKLIYNIAFKSLCLDWAKRRSVSTNKSNLESFTSISDTNDTNTANMDQRTREADENLQYNLWTIGGLDILIRSQFDGEITEQNSNDAKIFITTKLDYQIGDGREEITTNSERATNWLRSYIGGQATTIEGRIDVVKNIITRVDKKQIQDIIGENWKPSHEIEALYYIFSKLHRMLLPGNYLLRHKPGDRNFLVYQNTTTERSSIDINLHAKYKDKKPEMGNSEASFIPAWKINNGDELHIPWASSFK